MRPPPEQAAIQDRPIVRRAKPTSSQVPIVNFLRSPLLQHVFYQLRWDISCNNVSCIPCTTRGNLGHTYPICPQQSPAVHVQMHPDAQIHHLQEDEPAVCSGQPRPLQTLCRQQGLPHWLLSLPRQCPQRAQLLNLWLTLKSMNRLITNYGTVYLSNG